MGFGKSFCNMEIPLVGRNPLPSTSFPQFIVLEFGFFFYIYNFTDLLFKTMLGLHCCMGFSLAVGSRGYSLVVV